jgi:alpha-glucosidase
MTAPWWRDAVVYQVYVRSFADCDGDGLGDLAGIRSRLPYLRDLGVDAIWLNPCYPSPQADAGYDVADYRDVDPRFGTLDDMDTLITASHDNGLRILLDIVPNHTSDEHQWFQAALATGPGSPERDRYLFRDGPDPEHPPNDWQSGFGGPAWTRVDGVAGAPGQWYLHLFDVKQPDLDWTNEEVREEFRSILRFWFDRGVDGFRIDVAHGLAKDPAMPDIGHDLPAAGPDRRDHPHWDLDEVHDVYRDWRRVSDGYDGDRAFVAEAWVATPERLARYIRPDELHTAFNFELLVARWDASSLRRAIDTSIDAVGAVGAPATWVLANHDVVRHVTRYGGGARGLRRARAAALLQLALPGSAYVYQGDELGLPEVEDLPDEVRRDPVFIRTHGQLAGRDGCRIPMPWSGDRPPFGFGPAGRPWLPQPDEWAGLTVERQDGDPASTLSLYRVALALRRTHPALGAGTMDWIDLVPRALAFRREPGFACVVNLGSTRLRLGEALTGARPILASSSLPDERTVPHDTAVWYELP